MELYLDETFKDNIESPKVPAIQRLNYQRYKACNLDSSNSSYNDNQFQIKKSEIISIPKKKNQQNIFTDNEEYNKEENNFAHMISPQDYESLWRFRKNIEA